MNDIVTLITIVIYFIILRIHIGFIESKLDELLEMKCRCENQNK